MRFPCAFGTQSVRKTDTKEKGLVGTTPLSLNQYGRCNRIRTYDPLHPIQ